MVRELLERGRGLRIIDGVWLLLWSVFIFAGMPLATFHGDEAMHVYMSKDYVTAFFDHAPENLKTTPPYYIDSDQQLRILNGSITRYLIGLSWHVAGYDRDVLPPAPGWDWGLSPARNTETNHRPSPEVLNLARLHSTVFLCLGLGMVFLIARRLSGYGAAYAASALFALNPVILLNGRRANQEGGLLGFGLLAVWVAVEIAAHRRDRQPVSPLLWLLLALACGLAVLSKHSAIIFVGAALAWVVVSDFIHRRRETPLTLVKSAAMGVLAFGLFFACSPALWTDPVARFQDLLVTRATLLQIQINVEPTAPTPISQRVTDMLVEPFIKPPMHFEFIAWGDDPVIAGEVVRYMGSPLSGLQAGPILGGLLMLSALVGLVWAIRRCWRDGLAAGLLLWLGLTVASLLVNPLPWQRYYVGLIPVVILLASCGIGWGITRVLNNDDIPVKNPS